MSNIVWNSTDFSALGLVTPGVAGVHDLIPVVRSRQFLPGSSMPCDTITRDHDLGRLALSCVVAGSSHADLVSRLAAIKKAGSPRAALATHGWAHLSIEGMTGKRTYATPDAFPVAIDALPYLTTVVEFGWDWTRVGWWEDATATTAPDPASINNTGDLATWPTYTCTATDTLAGGLTFTVNGKTFEYTGALVATDVLVIDAEAMTCTLNGTEDMANVADDTDWPELVTGANAVSKSSASYTLAVEYRKRYE